MKEGFDMSDVKVKDVKKSPLRERIKKYLIENSEIISTGIIAMNGGNCYTPPKKRSRGKRAER